MPTATLVLAQPATKAAVPTPAVAPTGPYKSTPVATTVRRRTLNALASAFALDRQLRSAFLACAPEVRLALLDKHNREYARHYGQHLVELNEEEAALLMTLEVSSIQDLYTVLAELIERLPSANAPRKDGVYLQEDTSAA
jgi:hypothetical protein